MSLNKNIEDYFLKLNDKYNVFKNDIGEFISNQMKIVTDENDSLRNKLEECQFELENLSKVSIISNLNKQINNYKKELSRYETESKKQKNIISNLNIQLELLNDEIDILKKNIQKETNLKNYFIKFYNQEEEEEEEVEEEEEEVEEEDEEVEEDEEEEDGYESTDSEYYELEIDGKIYCNDNKNNIYEYEDDIIGDIIGTIQKINGKTKYVFN